MHAVKLALIGNIIKDNNVLTVAKFFGPETDRFRASSFTSIIDTVCLCVKMNAKFYKICGNL